MRVGAVDLGSNSTRLLVADVENGSVREVERDLRITRLAEGVDTRRKLLPVAIARARNVLSDFRRTIERLEAERVLAVATSAVRDADNGEAFLGEIEWSYGFDTRLLSGDEEAATTFRGVTTGRPLEPGTLIVDIGGGSTELIRADRHTSLDIGSVRLTERYGEDADAAGDYATSLLPDWEAADAIGVAGTITSLAALDLRLAEYDPERVHGHRLSAAAVDEQLARLSALTVDQRRELPGLDPGRAPVIVAGTAILRAILRRYGLGSIDVSEHDLLYGVALAAAELPARDDTGAPPGAFTCC
ncbi:MAG TPA: Ppx/GppA phosphatase family protein [Gaiellaceae bacterium]|nr:Ppx/GppA phosphatase family protein [Gaiellaceae bacterium]